MKFSDETIRLLEKLAKFLGIDKTAVTETAIHALARHHKIKESK